MRFKREESFRFSFGKPMLAFFTIDEINGNAVETSEGTAKLIDVSPNGLKLCTSLDIPFSHQNPSKVSIRFLLIEIEYKLHGEIVWKDKHDENYFYGIHFSIEENMQQKLISDIKKCARETSA